MSEDQDLKQHSSLPQQETAPSSVSPVIAWEQSRERSSTNCSNSNVIDIDTYRRQDSTTIDSEATVTVREFPSFHNEEPVRLIMVSSGFGQKITVHANMPQCKAA
ncbi:hypothetical protein [Paenibacillus oryzisoli]|uniref:Uncharacterized protein n=1 Tax=Paenibacillus oryzisoli TaxID=1850517 RepID=A0A198AE50_9BACL|nr:hypothetical protein [Paenibacillus oryzisoli]OAS19223.1 hypothetical protein A8708_26280 [Paenibacillus oryzisoli]